MPPRSDPRLAAEPAVHQAVDQAVHHPECRLPPPSSLVHLFVVLTAAHTSELALLWTTLMKIMPAVTAFGNRAVGGDLRAIYFILSIAAVLLSAFVTEARIPMPFTNVWLPMQAPWLPHAGANACSQPSRYGTNSLPEGWSNQRMHSWRAGTTAAYLRRKAEHAGHHRLRFRVRSPSCSWPPTSWSKRG